MFEPDYRLGHYVVEVHLGGGGMAEVYRVRHTVLGTTHAVKVLRTDLAVHEDIRQRFLAEGRIQAQLRHPNIVHVTDIIAEPGLAALVMDFVNGQTLGDFVAGLKRPPETALVRSLFTQILAGVGAAHARGIVHRDIKPSNILIERQEDGSLRALVLDFGIAREEGAKRHTRAGARMGTVGYMSPEQIRGAKEITATSDIFSLGIVLYELATGKPTFIGDSDYDIEKAIVEGAWIDPLAQYPGIEPGIAAAIRKAMARDPTDRFLSAADFAKALAPSSVPAPVPQPGPTLPPAPAQNESETAPQAERATGVESDSFPQTSLQAAPARSHRRAVILSLGIAGVLLVGAIAAAVLHRTPRPCEEASSSDKLALGAVLMDKHELLPASRTFARQALDAFRAVTTTDAQCTQAWDRFADASYWVSYQPCGAGSFAEAEAAVQKGLALEAGGDRRKSLLYTLGRIRAAQLRWDDAETAFQDARHGTADPKIDAWLEDLQELKQPSAALLLVLTGVRSGAKLSEADLSSFNATELRWVRDAISSRYGRQMNKAPMDWLFYCDESPLQPHGTLNVSYQPGLLDAADKRTLRLVERLQVKLPAGVAAAD